MTRCLRFIQQIFNAKVRDFDAVVSDQSEHGKCIVTALRDIKAGSEVFVTYGPLSNSRLLLRYGYVEEQNPFDQVDVCMHAHTAYSRKPNIGRHFHER